METLRPFYKWEKIKYKKNLIIWRNRPDLIIQITNKTIFKQLSNRLIQYRSSFLGSDC